MIEKERERTDTRSKGRKEIRYNLYIHDGDRTQKVRKERKKKKKKAIIYILIYKTPTGLLGGDNETGWIYFKRESKKKHGWVEEEEVADMHKKQ